jgi:hypothetical protein
MSAPAEAYRFKPGIVTLAEGVYDVMLDFREDNDKESFATFCPLPDNSSNVSLDEAYGHKKIDLSMTGFVLSKDIRELSIKVSKKSLIAITIFYIGGTSSKQPLVKFILKKSSETLVKRNAHIQFI